MKITVIGTGYVGLVSGACFAEMGNTVTCIDIDKKKIENLRKGIIPIYEPGLEEMVMRNIKNESLLFGTDLANSLAECRFAFISVGTPTGEDGSADLQYVLKVAQEIGQVMQEELIIVDKSTVPVGTADKVKAAIQKELENRNVDIPFHVVSNPEFLKEGDAVNDFMKPDRVIIGVEDDYSKEQMSALYAPFFRTKERLITMDVRSAEMTKYVANAMLATKISFMNEIANICELVGADVNKVRIGIGSDSRIGYSFIYPGSGYGGSCFPKDIKALRKTAADHGYDPQLIEAVENVNDRQRLVIADKILKRFGHDLKDKIFAVWGLAFKPETDDMREAPSLYIINKLVEHGATIQAYDPKAMEEARNYYLKDLDAIHYCESKYDTLKNADAMILMTEWKEFRSPDFAILKKELINPIVFDGRNQYNAVRMKKRGFEYYQIGNKDPNTEL